MNPSTTAPEDAPQTGPEMNLQHLDALFEAFRRECEQAYVAYQEAVNAGYAGLQQRAQELRVGLGEELRSTHDEVWTRARAEAEQVVVQARGEAEQVAAHARGEAEQLANRAQSEAENLLETARAQAEEALERAKTEGDGLIGNARSEADEVVGQAQAEAEALLARANAEADVIIARANTTAAEKVLAHRSGSPVAPTRTAQPTETAQAVLSPAESAPAEEAPKAEEAVESPSLLGLAATGASLLGSSMGTGKLGLSQSLLAPKPSSIPSGEGSLLGKVETASTPVAEALTPSPTAETISPVAETPVLPPKEPTGPVVESTPLPLAETPPSVPVPVVLETPPVAEAPAETAPVPEPAAPVVTESPSAEVATPEAPVSPVNLPPLPSMPPAPEAVSIPPVSAQEVTPVIPEPVQAVAPVQDQEPEPEPVVETPPSPPSDEPELVERSSMLRIVSSKTGYPVEMLEEHLESGRKLQLTPPKLIDIFAEMTERFPKAPALDLARIGELVDLHRLFGYTSKPDEPKQIEVEVVEPAPAPPAETPEASNAPSSPFQVAEEAPSKPVIPPDSPFREAAPSSPFTVADEGQAEASAPVESPFQAVSNDVVSPFQPAGDPGPVASPFQAVEEEVPQAVEAAPVPETPPAPAPTPEPAETEISVDRHVLRGHVAPPCGLGLPQLHDVDKIYIVPDGRRVAEALKGLLVADGFDAEVAKTVPPEARGVIFLGGLQDVSSAEQALAIQMEAFQAARSVMQGLADRRGLFVTVQDTGGDFGLSAQGQKEAWIGGLPGLVRTMAAECPDLGVKALDVEREGRSAEALARRILRELTAGGPEVEIGLSADGTRLTQALDLTERSECSLSVDENGVVVVHGVGQGIMTMLVLEMAKRKRLRFVLLGSVIFQEEAEDPFAALTDTDDLRKALVELSQQQPDGTSPEAIEQQLHTLLAQREVRFLMKELRAVGSTVCYFAVDSTDAMALETILTQVRGEWGGLSGILHSSNTREESRIDSKSEEEFTQVMTANLTGVKNLLKLTQQDQLQLIGFLSPSLHESGSAGNADYAMANEILNRIACAEAHRRGGQCVVRSVNWAFCDDGTVGQTARDALKSQGIDLVPRWQTGRVLVDELGQDPRGDAEVIIGPRRAQGLANLHTSYFNGMSEVLVNRKKVPQLEDHQIQGVAVVPGVMVMEWFLRHARQLAGPKTLLRCREFQQLQGIALPEYDQGSVPFSVVMDSLNGFQWGGQTSMRLLDMDGQLRYGAVLEKVEDEEALGLTRAPELELERTAWTGSHVYGPGALFHGPAFQVIHRVEGVSPQGALGRLVPPEEGGWPEDTYLFHPAMIDGVTQLAFVWGLFTQDNEYLVSSIGEFVTKPNANFNQALRCVLEGVDSSLEQLRLNAYLETDAGDTIAVMRNVECLPRT